MTAIIVILCILAALLILLLLPISLRVNYKESLEVRIRYLFVSVRVFPKKAKKKSAEAKRKQEIKQAAKEGKEDLSHIQTMLKEEGIAATASYLSEMLRLIGSAARRLLAAASMDIRLRIIVASEDAAQTAVDYGRVCAAVYPLEAALECLTHVRRRRVVIIPDFTKTQGEFEGDIRLSMMPIRDLWIGLRFLRGYMKTLVRQDKSGASYNAKTSG